VKERIYLDYNSTTPLHPDCRQAGQAFAEAQFGNPSSVHGEGRAARQATEEARARLATFFGRSEREVLFAASATEANHLAILGAWLHRKDERPKVVISAVEHPCVLGAAALAQRLGAEVVHLPVDGYGRVQLDAASAHVDDRTAVVSVMLANNEVGTVQPIAALAACCERVGALFHVDAAQAAGKIAVNDAANEASLLTVSGHKMYAGRGAAALMVRDGVRLIPLLAGHQERGRRGGTENVEAIVRLGKAAELAAAWQAQSEVRRQGGMRDALWAAVQGRLSGAERLGHPTECLPNTLCFRVAGVSGEALVMGLDLEGVAVSSGAACASGSTEPSHVLLAMGLAHDDARGAVRVSLGLFTQPDEVDRAGSAIVRVAERALQAASRLSAQMYED
jgi:cysteine desulfurase